LPIPATLLSTGNLPHRRSKNLDENYSKFNKIAKLNEGGSSNLMAKTNKDILLIST